MRRGKQPPALIMARAGEVLLQCMRDVGARLNQSLIPNPGVPAVLTAAIVPVADNELRCQFAFGGMGPIGLQLIASEILHKALAISTVPATADPDRAERIRQALAVLGSPMPATPPPAAKLN